MESSPIKDGLSDLPCKTLIGRSPKTLMRNLGNAQVGRFIGLGVERIGGAGLLGRR
jgi:hypothetical protein